MNIFSSKKIKYEVGPRRAGDSKYIVLNPKKFMKATSWKPKFNNLKYILQTAIKLEKNY